MAMHKFTDKTIQSVKKRTSIGDGLRKRGSFKGRKKYRGQGKG